MAPRTRLRRSAPALVLAGLSLLAGCHSGTPAAKRPFAAYRQCLQDHGVQPRNRRRGTSSTTAAAEATTTTTRPDPAAFAAARQACRKLRPAGGLRTGGFGSGPRAAFRKCMTDHGVTLPTEPRSVTSGPPPTKGKETTTTAGAVEPSRGGMLAGLNRNDPAVRSALEACRPLLSASSTTTTKK
ncbi:MAG TPA: hypothetical protein VGO87_09955 [Acidimicrobiia bacterium]|jgi:hypothetical protein